MEITDLEPLVGEWEVSVAFPGHDGRIGGRTSFEWLQGGGYLIERAVTDDPRFPRGLMVIGPTAEGDRIVQHYFDSRGVARIYEISLENGELRLWRDGPDFAQRYIGRLSEDERSIEGAWEIDEDGRGWRHDFDLNYRKVA